MFCAMICSAQNQLTKAMALRDEFNEELASLLRNIAEDAKTERATDEAPRPASSGLGMPRAITSTPPDHPVPHAHFSSAAKPPGAKPSPAAASEPAEPSSGPQTQPTSSPEPSSQPSRAAPAEAPTSAPEAPNASDPPGSTSAAHSSQAAGREPGSQAGLGSADDSQPASTSAGGARHQPRSQDGLQAGGGPEDSRGSAPTPQAPQADSSAMELAARNLPGSQPELLHNRPMSRRGREAAAAAGKTPCVCACTKTGRAMMHLGLTAKGQLLVCPAIEHIRAAAVWQRGSTPSFSHRGDCGAWVPPGCSSTEAPGAAPQPAAAHAVHTNEVPPVVT